MLFILHPITKFSQLFRPYNIKRRDPTVPALNTWWQWREENSTQMWGSVLRWIVCFFLLPVRSPSSSSSAVWSSWATRRPSAVSAPTRRWWRRCAVRPSGSCVRSASSSTCSWSRWPFWSSWTTSWRSVSWRTLLFPLTSQLHHRKSDVIIFQDRRMYLKVDDASAKISWDVGAAIWRWWPIWRLCSIYRGV